MVTRKVWVIVDKKRKLIGMGVPRNRSLKMIDDYDGTGRILTYGSKKKAEAGFKSSGFYTWGLGDYLLNEYGYCCWGNREDPRAKPQVRFEDFLEAVEATISIS